MARGAAAPRDVPIVVTGPQAAVVADLLDRGRPGAFDVRTRPDEAAARAAIANREAYGAVVTSPSGPKVLTASAASPLVAQQLAAMATRLEPGAPRRPHPSRTWSPRTPTIPAGPVSALSRSR